MDFVFANNVIGACFNKRAYVMPQIQVSTINMDSNFAAGSVVNISVENTGTPNVTEWEARDTEEIWNF